MVFVKSPTILMFWLLVHWKLYVERPGQHHVLNGLVWCHLMIIHLYTMKNVTICELVWLCNHRTLIRTTVLFTNRWFSNHFLLIWTEGYNELFSSLFFCCHCRRKLFVFFSRTSGPISIKLGTKHPLVKGIQICLNEGPRISKGR